MLKAKFNDDIPVLCGGVTNGVIRVPETADFDITDFSHWEKVYKGFTDEGIKPIIIEPLPNELNDHIKAGDEKRDESIEKFIKMLEYMDRLDIRCVCFNFMAHIGRLRTKKDIKERGGTLVTGSTQGIGLAVARCLAEHGAKVYINGATSLEKCRQAVATVKNSVAALQDLYRS